MEKILLYTATILFAIISLYGCSDDSKYPAPTALDQSTISAEAKPGAIKLKWTVPSDSNYYYVRVTYTIPETGKECLRLASVKSDTMLVDNLLARYGDITFTLQPCNKDGEGTAASTVTAKALPAPKTVLTEKTKVILSGNQLYTDSQESSEGPIENLVDNNKSTYFHMSWGAATPFPHYIVVDLKDDLISSFQFSYACRDHGNRDNPKDIDILVSNEFTPGNYDDSKTILLESYINLPDGKGAEYESKTIRSGGKYRYLWVKINSSTSDKDWVALSELSLSKIKISTYDPETGETIVE